MKNKILIAVSCLLTVVILVTGGIFVFKKASENKVDISTHLSAFSDTSKMSYSSLFYELSYDEMNATN